MKGTKKVVILDNVNSPLISHAIFILRDMGESEFSALLEAERIVEEYMAGTKSKKKSRAYVYAISAVSVISVMLFLYFYFKF